MSDLLFQGLIITGIGMGLVFVAIVFLWGLMALMVRLDSRIKQAEAVVSSSTMDGTEPSDLSAKYQAAAAAVAVAIACQKGQAVFPDLVSRETATAWKQIKRAQVLQEKTRVIIHRQDRRS